MQSSIISLARSCVSLDAFAHMAGVEWRVWVVFNGQLDRFGSRPARNFAR
jgi:hypothetical protein